MTSTICLRAAGLVAALSVIAIGALNGITMHVNNPVTVSLFLLAISVGILLCGPSLVKSSLWSDAPALALIGPTGGLCGVLVVLSGSTLFLAANNAPRLTLWSLDVVYAAVLLIGLGALGAARSIVVAASGSDRLAAPHTDTDRW